MARMLVVVAVLAAVTAVGAAMFARTSGAAPAAQIQRTFVSTSGNDANPCTRAEPCRGFAAAIANTLAGGEVIALDSGGYGAFSVDKSITVAGAPGAHVAISVFSGTGITVNAPGASDRIVLRNLFLTGLGGVTGILFQAGGSLHVESVVAAGFSARGLDATAVGANLFVRDSVFRHNGESGVLVDGSLRTEIARARADRNGGHGFWLRNAARGSIADSVSTRNAGGHGFRFDSGAVLAVSDSLADGNAGSGLVVFDADTQAMLTGLELTNNALHGLLLAFGTPVARIGGSTVTGNSNVGLSNSAGTLETFGDNLVRGNTTSTSGTITTVAKT